MKCREKFDRIFSVKMESAEQERKLLTKWLKSLCKDCKKLPLLKLLELQIVEQA
jgi:hypothetical protein